MKLITKKLRKSSYKIKRIGYIQLPIHKLTKLRKY